ncbi:MAG: hypothetical protein ACI8ZM_005598 [Crocinitomix sp.]|jgi:hypothetical protein
MQGFNFYLRREGGQLSNSLYEDLEKLDKLREQILLDSDEQGLYEGRRD